jgi:hypothetical protein
MKTGKSTKSRGCRRDRSLNILIWAAVIGFISVPSSNSGILPDLRSIIHPDGGGILKKVERFMVGREREAPHSRVRNCSGCGAPRSRLLFPHWRCSNPNRGQNLNRNLNRGRPGFPNGVVCRKPKAHQPEVAKRFAPLDASGMFVLARFFVLLSALLISSGAGSLSAQETGAATAVGDQVLNPEGRLLFFAVGEIGSLIGIRSLFELCLFEVNRNQ